MSTKHLRVETVSPVSNARTEFVLWYDTPEEEYAGRCILRICTGCAVLHAHPTAAECRALAANLLAMAEAIEGDTGEAA